MSTNISAPHLTNCSSPHVNPDIAPLTYSIEQCCNLTSLKRTTVFNLIRSNRLRVVHIGRRTLVLASSLHDLLNGKAA